MSNVSKETMARVDAIYDPYLSMAEMARYIGVTTATVRRALVALGLSTQRRYAPPEPLPPIDLIWVAEFRGFFYADGYAGLKKKARPRPQGTVTPNLCIRQRVDGIATLRVIQSILGGHISVSDRYHQSSHPQAAWEVYGWAACRVVIEATDLDREWWLPANKREDVQILHEAILVRYGMPRDILTPDQKAILWDYYDRLKEVKRYQL